MVAMNESEKKLGEMIVGNLTDDGYLNAQLEDLAREAGVELEDAEEVLKLVAPVADGWNQLAAAPAGRA